VLACDRFAPPPGQSPTAAGRASPHLRAIGRAGEEVAAAHFRELGFAVLACNARTRHGEIDLIVCDGDVIVFAEVKTRRVAASMGRSRFEEEPLADLRPRQRARLRRLARGWLADRANVRPNARTIRFDAIGVLLDGRTGTPVRVDHIEDAW
jgi:putative endonuclease